jgi:hypothetical protein
MPVGVTPPCADAVHSATNVCPKLGSAAQNQQKRITGEERRRWRRFERELDVMSGVVVRVMIEGS